MATATTCACCSAAAPLSRCGRCARVSYCSRECQARHWTRGGHRQLCAALRKAAAFRRAELQFWASRSPAELAQFEREEGGLDPAAMSFYGEVLFVLAGLKPSMMFSNLPRSWRRQFVVDVVATSGVLDEPRPPTCAPSLCVVEDNLQTLAEYSLQDTLVLVNKSHAACASIHQALALHAVVIDDPQLDRPLKKSQVRLVDEATLARYLDYPVALSECVEPMIEVGYFAVDSDGSRRLLLSYCASAIASHLPRINSHFKKYQQEFDSGTLVLAMVTTALS